MPKPKPMPINPPMSEMRTASTRNCRITSRWRAPRARRTPISRVRSRMDASMNVHDPDATNQQTNGRNRHHDQVKDVLRPLLLRQQFRWRDHAEVAGITMGNIKQRANNVRRGHGIKRGAQLQIDAVDFVLHVAAAVFQAKHGGIERNVNQIVQILRGQRTQSNFARLAAAPPRQSRETTPR